MEVIDEDVQMVRDALKDAPEYVKMHFENLVEQHAAEAERAATALERVESLEQNEADEIEKLQDERNALQSRLDDIEGDGMIGALETVKYWMLGCLVHHRPMSDPRKILRTVEDALR